MFASFYLLHKRYVYRLASRLPMRRMKKTIASKEYLLSFIIMASLMFCRQASHIADLTGYFYQLYEMLNCVVALAGPTVTLSDVAIYLAT